MMMALEASARTTSVSLMAPTAEWIDVDADLGLDHLVERVLKSLDGTLDVGLDDQVELLDLGVGNGLEEVLERDVLDAALSPRYGP